MFLFHMVGTQAVAVDSPDMREVAAEWLYA